MLLEKVEDDVVVMVKDDFGQYDVANDAYEDTYAFWESRESCKKGEVPKQRKAFSSIKGFD